MFGDRRPRAQVLAGGLRHPRRSSMAATAVALVVAPAIRGVRDGDRRGDEHHARPPGTRRAPSRGRARSRTSWQSRTRHRERSRGLARCSARCSRGCSSRRLVRRRSTAPMRCWRSGPLLAVLPLARGALARWPRRRPHARTRAASSPSSAPACGRSLGDRRLLAVHGDPERRDRPARSVQRAPDGHRHRPARRRGEHDRVRGGGRRASASVARRGTSPARSWAESASQRSTSGRARCSPASVAIIGFGPQLDRRPRPASSARAWAGRSCTSRR